jgi:hypothetical protein
LQLFRATVLVSGGYDPGLFSYQEILQNFSDYPSTRISGHIHKTLNIDKK